MALPHCPGTRVYGATCPKWVNLDFPSVGRSLPYPDEQKFHLFVGMSQTAMNGSHAASRADRLSLVNGIEVKLGGSRKSKIAVSTCLASVAVGHGERVDRPCFANCDKAVAVAEPSGKRRQAHATFVILARDPHRSGKYITRSSAETRRQVPRAQSRVSPPRSLLQAQLGRRALICAAGWSALR